MKSGKCAELWVRVSGAAGRDAGEAVGLGRSGAGSPSPACQDRWLVLLFNSSSRLYVRPVGERVRCEKRGQWARIG